MFASIAEGQPIDDLVRRLQACSYRCWRQETPLFNPDNFNRRANDIFSRHCSLALIAFPEESESLAAPAGCVELA